MTPQAAQSFRETLRQFLASFGGTVEADGAALLEQYDAAFDPWCPVVLTNGQRCQLRAGHTAGYHIADAPSIVEPEGQ